MWLAVPDDPAAENCMCILEASGKGHGGVFKNDTYLYCIGLRDDKGHSTVS
jgi:hypothetical protein